MRRWSHEKQIWFLVQPRFHGRRRGTFGRLARILRRRFPQPAAVFESDYEAGVVVSVSRAATLRMQAYRPRDGLRSVGSLHLRAGRVRRGSRRGEGPDGACPRPPGVGQCNLPHVRVCGGRCGGLLQSRSPGNRQLQAIGGHAEASTPDCFGCAGVFGFFAAGRVVDRAGKIIRGAAGPLRAAYSGAIRVQCRDQLRPPAPRLCAYCAPRGS